MFAAILQAASLPKGRRGFIPLDPKVDADLVARYRALAAGRPLQPISDPHDWVAQLRAFGASLRAHLAAEGEAEFR
jgi:hypothetical protein